MDRGDRSRRPWTAGELSREEEVNSTLIDGYLFPDTTAGLAVRTTEIDREKARGW